MNHLGNLSYRYRAVPDHPSHGLYHNMRRSYGDEIKRAKERHWKDFLESVSGNELWTAHQYVSSPVGDGGKACIPTLKTVSGDGTRNDVSTNEEKGDVLHQLFFPERPPGSHIPHEPLYPDRIRYSFRPSLTQLCQCIARLHPQKVPGQDGIPNIVLKESLRGHR